MMRHKSTMLSVLILSAISSILLAGCGGTATYKDGTYEGKSEIFEYENEDDSDDGNGYGVVKITVKDQKISECTFETYEPDGTKKDENYGKKNGSVAEQDYYNKAQKAVAACAEYASQLVQNGSLDGIDAISGATKNYEQFQDAVRNALESAKE